MKEVIKFFPTSQVDEVGADPALDHLFLQAGILFSVAIYSTQKSKTWIKVFILKLLSTVNK